MTASSSSNSTPEILSLSSHENDEDDNENDTINDDDDDGNGDDNFDNNDVGDTSDTCASSPNEEKNMARRSSPSSGTSSVCSIHIDNFLTSFGKFTEKSMYTERGIKLLQWTIWLISQLTKNNQRLPKEFSPSFRKLYVDLSNMRYVLRLYGFPGSWAAVRGGGRPWAGSPPYSYSHSLSCASASESANSNSCWKDGRITTLANVMAWSMFIYHPLEHVAYANWTMPKLLRRIDGNKLSAWSCRFWLAFIVADWAGSYLKNCELSNHKKTLLMERNSISNSISGSNVLSKSHSNSNNNAHDDDRNQNQHDKIAKEIEAIEKCIKMNRLQMVRNFFFFPPCLNWSLDKWATDPLLSENFVNGFSLAEAIVCIYQSVLTL